LLLNKWRGDAGAGPGWYIVFQRSGISHYRVFIDDIGFRIVGGSIDFDVVSSINIHLELQPTRRGRRVIWSIKWRHCWHRHWDNRRSVVTRSSDFPRKKGKEEQRTSGKDKLGGSAWASAALPGP